MASQRQIFLQHIAQTSPSPLSLEVVGGEGIYLFTADGKKYLDLISGISVSSLGHNHPAIVSAVQNQAAKYMHTLVYGEYILSPQTALANMLCSLLPPSLDNVYFTNSGTEATEGAMKLAKRFTGRSEIIAFHYSYHGSTQGALSLLGDEYFRSAFRPLLPDIRHIRYNAITDLAQISERTAAVFIEPLQAESGATTIDGDFCIALNKRCKQMGALLVIDEIQTGCGRLGTMFAFEQYELVPDILLLAKAFGGGMPLGAFVSSKNIMQSLTHNPVLGHITTFGGHPVSCAAALSSLSILKNDTYIAQVSPKEQLFRELLIHDEIVKISGKGLLLSMHLQSQEKVQSVIHRCLEHGLITDWFLFAPHCIRIAPPLTISEEQIVEACKILLASLS
jgi:acetylornithine/succinyldiaminopimelate/putrescine aminotransferase